MSHSAKYEENDYILSKSFNNYINFKITLNTLIRIQIDMLIEMKM